MRIIWLWVAITIFFTVGALRVVFRGQLPNEIAPMRIMNPSNFNSPEQIGALTFRRFWQELNFEKTVVIGSALGLSNYEKIWMGFISVGNAKGLRFDKIFEQASLRRLNSQSNPLDWQKIYEAAALGQRVLIHVEATSEMWREVRTKIKKSFFIFQSALPTNEAGRKLLRQECEKSARQSQYSQYENLACATMTVSRRGRKTKTDLRLFSVVIEKLGDREHILYVQEPIK